MRGTGHFPSIRSITRQKTVQRVFTSSMWQMGKSQAQQRQEKTKTFTLVQLQTGASPCHETRESHEDRSGRVGPRVRDLSWNTLVAGRAWIGHKNKRVVHHGSLPQQLLPWSYTHSYGKSLLHMECAKSDGHVRNTHGCSADKHLRIRPASQRLPVKSDGFACASTCAMRHRPRSWQSPPKRLILRRFVGRKKIQSSVVLRRTGLSR